MIGVSLDLGVCKTKRRDGTPCTMTVNLKTTEYCEFHIASEFKKLSSTRYLFFTKSGKTFDNNRVQSWLFSNFEPYAMGISQPELVKMVGGGEIYNIGLSWTEPFRDHCWSRSNRRPKETIFLAEITKSTVSVSWTLPVSLNRPYLLLQEQTRSQETKRSCFGFCVIQSKKKLRRIDCPFSIPFFFQN